MKNKFLFFLIISLLLSCNKEDIITGVIVQEVDLSICLSSVLDYETDNEFIFKEDSTYDNFLNLHKAEIEQNCENYQFPEIDFSSYSLIGKLTMAEGKIKYYKREVIINDDNSKYIYTITVYTKSFNKIQAVDYNWVLVPKIPENYTVEFNIIYK